MTLSRKLQAAELERQLAKLDQIAEAVEKRPKVIRQASALGATNLELAKRSKLSPVTIRKILKEGLNTDQQ
jgi:hypothetical protein